MCTFVTTFLKTTMRTFLPKTLDLVIFDIHLLNFSLDNITHISFVTNQLNISDNIWRKNTTFLLIGTKLHQFR